MTEKQHLALLATTVVFYIALQEAFSYPTLCHNHIVSITLHVILLLFVHQVIIRYFSDKKINPSNKAVLITGCDTGFGNLLAKRLEAIGFHVFASCLFLEGSGANDLKQTCSDRLKVLPLDVSSDESVSDALEFVKENLGSNVLWGVVNNAGTAKGSAVDFSTIKHFQETMEINAFGPVRVSKAFLPLLKNSKGRVVNVSSFLGVCCGPMICPYTMSKHAVTAFTKCLALEMMAWRVRVIAIEPEAFRTPIFDMKANTNRMKSEREEIDESIISSYGEKYFEQLEKAMDTTAKLSSSNIDIVVDDMVSALTKVHPKCVYKPRWSWPTKTLSCILENAPFYVQLKILQVFLKLIHYPLPCSARM